MIEDSSKMTSTTQSFLEKTFNSKSYAESLMDSGFSKVKVEDGLIWMKISVNLKPSPELEITEDMHLNRAERSEFIEKRNVYFKLKINETLDKLLGKDIQSNGFAPEGFSVWVNEEGLKRVLENEAVEYVNCSGSNSNLVPFISHFISESNDSLILLVTLIIVLIVLIILYSKKKKHKT